MSWSSTLATFEVVAMDTEDQRTPNYLKFIPDPTNAGQVAYRAWTDRRNRKEAARKRRRVRELAVSSFREHVGNTQ